jgi:hypothetical protein
MKKGVEHWPFKSLLLYIKVVVCGIVCLEGSGKPCRHHSSENDESVQIC